MVGNSMPYHKCKINICCINLQAFDMWWGILKGITLEKKKVCKHQLQHHSRANCLKRKDALWRFLFIYSFKDSLFSWLESFSAGIFYPYGFLKGYEEIWGSASQHIMRETVRITTWVGVILNWKNRELTAKTSEIKSDQHVRHISRKLHFNFLWH